MRMRWKSSDLRLVFSLITVEKFVSFMWVALRRLLSSDTGVICNGSCMKGYEIVRM